MNGAQPRGAPLPTTNPTLLNHGRPQVKQMPPMRQWAGAPHNHSGLSDQVVMQQDEMISLEEIELDQQSNQRANTAYNQGARPKVFNNPFP